MSHFFAVIAFAFILAALAGDATIRFKATRVERFVYFVAAVFFLICAIGETSAGR